MTKRPSSAGAFAERLASQRAGSRGEPLPEPTRRAMERLLGADLGDVRVFVGPAAAALGAQAFALGHELHFAPGRFEPGSAAGWEVLAHELTHVLQQRCGSAGRADIANATLLHDEALEAQARAMGAAAVTMFRTGTEPQPARRCWSPERRPMAGHAVQCLMDLAEFKQRSDAPGFRDKIKRIDVELSQFHLLDKAVPRSYRALLAQLRKLFKATVDYATARPGSKRQAGVDLLARQIAMEETVIASLADFEGATDVFDQWEYLEATQERYLQIKGRDHFTRKGFSMELDNLIQNHRHKLENAPGGAKAILKDVEELKRIALRSDLPDSLAAVIHEVTSAGNMQQLSMGSVYSAGAKYNTTRGVQPKYTLNHNLNQGSGRKLRIGSLLHELTHVSVAETYGNTVLMLAIDPAADDAAIVKLAARRKARLLSLKDDIDRANDLPADLLGELKSKVEYPLCGKFVTYISNFKAQFTPELFERLKALNRRGVDCELIEYDSVINQMAMWCHLYAVERSHPVYRQLLTLVQLEFGVRSAQRTLRRRVVSPAGGAAVQRLGGRRMSVG